MQFIFPAGLCSNQHKVVDKLMVHLRAHVKKNSDLLTDEQGYNTVLTQIYIMNPCRLEKKEFLGKKWWRLEKKNQSE